MSPTPQPFPLGLLFVGGVWFLILSLSQQSEHERLEKEITCVAQGYTVIYPVDRTSIWNSEIVCQVKRNR